MDTEKAKNAKARLVARLDNPRIRTRIANTRLAIERAGGVNKVAELLGYANASYLSQMFGPNPTRVPSEKIVQRMEKTLGLAEGELDRPLAAVVPSKVSHSDSHPVSQIDSEQLSRMIALATKIIEEEKVQLSRDRFASLVSLAYEESAEHAGRPSESKLRQVVRLLK